MKNSTRKILVNLIGCLAFLSIPILTSPDFDQGLEMIHIAPFQRYFFRYLFLIVLFYANYYWFIPKFYVRGKRWQFFLICIFSYLLLVYLPNLFWEHSSWYRFGRPGGFPVRKRHPLWEIHQLIPYLLMLSFSMLIKLNRNFSKIKTEKLNAEVSYLKAQINPHFLFNTLNSLYALTLSKSDKAPDAVLKLSNMMRYVVTESSADFVSLEKEINHIQDYISLQQLRMDDSTDFSISIQGDFHGKMIAPLILIPFIENAFKYGINPDADSLIKIEINIAENDFVMNVKNSVVNIDIPEMFKSEKGLENTMKRLKHIYPNRHDLKIQKNDGIFEVNLKINLG